MNRNLLDIHILRVDKYYRIILPQALLQQVEWIRGNQKHDAWLLMAGPGRCRLLSTSEVENDSQLQSLQARIAAELGTDANNTLDFRDEASIALALRLSPIQIAPPDPGWRLLLPKPIAAIMQIRAGESDIAVLFVHNHIELWTVEILRSSVTPPLNEILI